MDSCRHLLRDYVTLLLLLATPCWSAAESNPRYWVTAIYGTESSGLTALLRLGDGSTKRVRAGDRLDHIMVEFVAKRWILVRADDAPKPHRIWLDGYTDPRAMSAARDSRSTAVSAGKQEVPLTGLATAGAPLPEVRSLPELAERIDQLLPATESARRPLEDLGPVIVELLGLPLNALLLEMQSGAPTTFQDAIREVRDAAAVNSHIRLTMELDGVRHRVMVFPASAEDVARVRVMNMEEPEYAPEAAGPGATEPNAEPTD